MLMPSTPEQSRKNQLVKNIKYLVQVSCELGESKNVSYLGVTCELESRNTV